MDGWLYMLHGKYCISSGRIWSSRTLANEVMVQYSGGWSCSWQLLVLAMLIGSLVWKWYCSFVLAITWILLLLSDDPWIRIQVLECMLCDGACGLTIEEQVCAKWNPILRSISTETPYFGKRKSSIKYCRELWQPTNLGITKSRREGKHFSLDLPRIRLKCLKVHNRILNTFLLFLVLKFSLLRCHRKIERNISS